MSIYYLTNDLMFPSRVSGVAQRLGLSLRMFSSLASLLDALSSQDCRLILLDLSLPGVDPAAAMEQLRAASPTVNVVAYGPHVHEALLQSASAAGCSEVLARGQFNHDIERVLRTYAAN